MFRSLSAMIRKLPVFVQLVAWPLYGVAWLLSWFIVTTAGGVIRMISPKLWVMAIIGGLLGLIGVYGSPQMQQIVTLIGAVIFVVFALWSMRSSARSR